VEDTLTIALGGRVPQHWEQRLDQPHLGVEVDGHGAPHVLVAAVGEARVPGGARVVDEQVEPSVALEHVVADALRSLAVEQVSGEPADALVSERRCELLQPLLAAGDQHQGRLRLASEAARGRLPDAARGTGDQHHAWLVGWVGVLCHRVLAVVLGGVEGAAPGEAPGG